MNMKRDFLKKEGLYITEFSDSFFAKRMKAEGNNIRDKVKGLAYKIEEKIKDSDQNKWHIIFDTIQKELFPEGMKEALALNDSYVPDKFHNLIEIIKGFYLEPYFLELDVMQQIEYNLFRLGKIKTIDLEARNETDIDFLNVYQNLFEIGRHKYSDRKDDIIPPDWAKSYKKRQINIPKYEKSNKEYAKDKNKNEKRLVEDDLLKDLQYLMRKYEKKGSLSVEFKPIGEKSQVYVEEDNADCNLACLANEAFLDYLYRVETNRNSVGVMKHMIEEMNCVTDENVYYEWEKLTNYNVIIAVSKFIFDFVMKEAKDKRLTKKEQKNFAEQFVKREQKLFFRILSMKNYLLRLVLLKEIFTYIEGSNYAFIYELLDCLEKMLEMINQKYEKVQQSIYIYTVLIRWELAKKNDIDIWKRELLSEYSIVSLKRILLFQNIYRSVLTRNMLDVRRNGFPLAKTETSLESLKKEVNRIKLFHQFYTNLPKSVKKKSRKKNRKNMDKPYISESNFCFLPFWGHHVGEKGEAAYIKTCNFFVKFEDPSIWSDSNKIMQKMKENDIVTIDMVKIDEYEESVEGYIATPYGPIITAELPKDAVPSKVSIAEDEFYWKRNAESISLSEYSNIMFESMHVDENNRTEFEFILNKIFYHIKSS